jgi:hypothetical protein
MEEEEQRSRRAFPQSGEASLAELATTSTEPAHIIKANARGIRFEGA